MSKITNTIQTNSRKLKRNQLREKVGNRNLAQAFKAEQVEFYGARALASMRANCAPSGQAKSKFITNYKAI